MPAKIQVKAGDRYGRFTILKELEPHRQPYGKTKRLVRAMCDCGNVKDVLLDSLRRGNTKSCGCYNKEVTIKRATIHSCKATRAYNVWRNMKARCGNPNSLNYKYYGGRGITVCDRWENSFVNFLEDMGHPLPWMSLDRIDNNGPYSPNNCRWADRKTQNRNKRSNRIICVNGEKMTITDAAENAGINIGTLRYRIDDLGWSVEKALTEPVQRAAV